MQEWSLLAEQWFDMHDVHMHLIVLELCVMVKKKEEGKMSKIEIFRLFFLIMLKFSGTFGVDLAIE